MHTVPKKWAVIPFTTIQIVAFSATFYIVPQLVISKICLTALNQSVCNQLGQPKFKTMENYVFERAAAWNALINFAGFFPALIITLPLGAMTDLVSKKKMLLLPAIVSLVSSLIYLCSSLFIKLHVGFLVLASFVTCIFGELPGFVTLCCAYGAASSSSEDRTLVLSFIIASVRVGFGLGGLAVNYLKQYCGFTTVFLFTTAILMVNLLYAIVLIPPTDDGSEKSAEGEKYDFWNGFKNHTKDTWDHLQAFSRNHLLRAKNNTIFLLLLVAFLTLATNGGERALIVLFLKHSPLNVKADEIGLYITLYQCCRGFGLMFLSFVIVRHFPSSDYSLMFFGSVCMIIHYTFLSLSRTMLMAYLSTLFAIPSSFLASAVRSKLTKLASPTEHGTSLSLIGLVQVLGVLIMSVASNGLFIATVNIYSGFSILLMSFISCVSLAILCYTYYTKEHEGETTDDYESISTKEDEVSQK